jgi:hypothetical protein
MKVGALEETITVSAATPIVDVQNVAKISTTTREAMDVLPTDRNFVSFAALTPSVLVTGVRQNVGGSIPETGMNLVVHGSRAGDSLIMVDGMPIINGSGTGRPPVRQLLEQRPGAGDHLPDRLAQRRVRARERIFELHPERRVEHVSRLVQRTLRRRGVAVGQPRRRAALERAAHGQQDQSHLGLNPALGGPILKDRVWIYGSYRHWGTYNTVANSFKDADFSEIFYKPSTEQNLFPVWHQSAAARLTTQVTQKNKVNLYYDWQYTYFGNCFVPTYLTRSAPARSTRTSRSTSCRAAGARPSRTSCCSRRAPQ